MQEQLSDDILKAVGIRYIVNPELGHPDVAETEEMRQRTIAKLQWLNEVRPRCVLVADTQNPDPHAVMVRVLGKRVAYLDRNQAPLVRGMLKASPRGMLSTRITSVTVGAHGYFFLAKPKLNTPYTPEEIGVDWSCFQCDELLMLPHDYFLGHDELSMVIFDELLPDLPQVDLPELRLYCTRWMQSVRYNQSREVQREMRSLIARLSADERPEVRLLAVDIDHLRTKKGTKELNEEMAHTWWHDLIECEAVSQAFQAVKQHCAHNRQQLLCILDKIDQLMRPLPGELYRNVGSAYHFFSHLNYLAPPMTALRGVLSLLAIRTLLCRELGLTLEPFYGQRLEAIADVAQMPTTIGQVMEFAHTQCREYAELVTVQRLAQYLKEAYLGTRDAAIEGILDQIKPSPTIHIAALYGSATGQVTQNIDNPQLPE